MDSNVGDSLECVATIVDLDESSINATTSVTIENAAPVISQSGIAPTSAITTNSSIECSGIGTDIDQDSLSVSYVWTNLTQGTSLGSSTPLVLSPNISQPSDEIRCTVTIDDGNGGTATTSHSIVVDNTPPVFNSSSMSWCAEPCNAPNDGYNNDTVYCYGAGSDADNQSLTSSVVWTNSTTGAVIGNGTGIYEPSDDHWMASMTLDSSLAEPNDDIVCTMTLMDPSGGSDSGSASLTVGNRVPDAPTIAIVPDPAYTDSTITCSASDLVDPDGDSVTVSYEWTVEGNSAGVGDTLSSSAAAGEFVKDAQRLLWMSMAAATMHSQARQSLTAPQSSPIYSVSKCAHHAGLYYSKWPCKRYRR